MSFPPPRPPMTIPGMPPMMPPPYMGGMIPMTMSMMTAPMMAPIAHPPTIHTHKPPTKKIMTSAPLLISKPPEQPDDPKGSSKGPPITVFVGNITERASDSLIRQILQHCGTVISWKRVQGANGKLQAFGFCEYADPESGLRAIRLLHDWEIGEKKLVVKVDAKTKEKLDEYKAVKKVSELDGKTNDEKDNAKKLDNDLDEATKKDDERIRAIIKITLGEHAIELARIITDTRNSNEDKPKKLSKTQEALMKISLDMEKDPKNNLDEMDLEEEKKSLIHREIDKFRDTYKRAEEEKEREKREKERRDKDVRDKDRKDTRSRDHTPDRVRSSRGGYDRAREKSLDDRYSDRSSRSPSRDRDWGRDREDSRERSREREWEKEREEEEEALERKKLDRKLREKEAAYKERLRNWEVRERRRLKEYEKERMKEEEKLTEEMKEARRLKEFLEDYDDERDDPKYYKGSALARRMKEREKEIEVDSRDRQREKEELDELRRKLAEEGHPDPIAEANRLHQEEEAKFVKPKVKTEPEHKSSHVHLPVKEEAREDEDDQDEEEDEREGTKDDSTENSLISGFSDVTTPREEFKPLGFAGLKLGASPLAAKSPPQVQTNGKKKRTTVEEVFNEDQEETKKRKLVPLDDTQEDDKSSQSGTTQHLSTDEKRKHIKNLIDKIPTGKNELFAYSIDWSLVDSTLMERRIKPWINKKIIEYIGEEEQTLVEFICSKVLVGSSAQSILEDVSMVLDEEAEVFVVKMWRLLIYEIEAKKLGLVKGS